MATVVLTSVANAGDPYNLLFGLSPAAAIGHTIEYDAQTNLGASVELTTDGYYTIGTSASGTHTFNYRISDGVYGAWATITAVLISEGVLVFDSATVPVGTVHISGT